MDSHLRLHNVRHRYNGRTVLDIPELSIDRGSITGLVGPNGSGKSTMLRILSLVEECCEGSVFIDGEKMTRHDRRARHTVCYLPQEPYLLKRSVAANIRYGLALRGQKQQNDGVITEALELVGLPPNFAKRQWYELSGGEAQRVALAARLILRPACLLLDEPTASVDMESAHNIRKAMLLARREWGTTLILTSHQQSWLFDISDRLIFLYNGRLLDQSYTNLLLGPWEKEGHETWAMKLADGQKIYAQCSSKPSGCGIIAATSLSLCHSPSSEPNAAGNNILSGKVTGLFAYKNSASILVQVVCGEQQFMVDMAADAVEAKGIFPRKAVMLKYKPTDIVPLP